MKRILEGKNISSVLVGEELESLTINKVENKKELNILIEELKHLKSALEKETSTNKKETKKSTKAEINTSKMQ